jgi:hypothetical protein
MFRPNFYVRSLKTIRFICIFTFLAISIAFTFELTTVKSETFETETAAANQPADSTVLATELTHNLVASFYDLENYPTARLLLNNKGLSPVELRPTLYSLDGNAFEPAPVTVEPNSFRFVSINDLASAGGENFRKGSIKLFHTGKDLIIGSQVYLEKESQSLSFEERFGELGKFDSRRLEAIWYMPRGQTEATIILSNTSDEAISVSARLNRKGETQTFPLAPHQTRVLDLRQDFADGQRIGSSQVVGISLEHNGGKSALKAHGQIKDAPIGYSNIVTFSNPNTGKSSELHGFGLHLGAMDGENLEPVVALKNVGGSPASVTVKVPYTRADDTTGAFNLAPLTIKSGEMRLLDMTALIQRSRQEQIKIAGIEITSDAAPGSVLASVQSVSADKRQVFRVPLYDPYAQTSSTGGYPWRIDETSRTVFYIKNTTDLEKEYIAYLVWSGGQYMMGIKKIDARQTIEIDMKKLRDEQTPDERGNTIPLNVDSGQIKWTTRFEEYSSRAEDLKRFDLIGRSEQIDTVKGVSSSYACQNCCQKNAWALVYGEASSAEVGDFVQFYAQEYGSDCYGNSYNVQMPNGNLNWSTSNSGIATVDGYGLAQVVGVGNVDVKAQWYGTRTNNYGGWCPNPPFLTGETEEVEKAEIEKVETKEIDTDERPDCNGACSTISVSINDSEGLTATPKITINVPTSADDGDTATFSVTNQGGTPTGYQWSFTAPTGAGNSPQVNFASATSASTTAPAHWFALPNGACTASRDSTYTIKVQVTFSGGVVKNAQKAFQVKVPWTTAGVVNAAVEMTGLPTRAQTTPGTWVVTGMGALGFNPNATKTIFVSPNSQFYSKTDQHEDVHMAQWGPTGSRGQHYNVNTFYNRISGFTAGTDLALRQMIIADAVQFIAQGDAAVAAGCNQSEIDAYNVSDLLAPQYIYQRCGATTFSNC